MPYAYLDQRGFAVLVLKVNVGSGREKLAEDIVVRCLPACGHNSLLCRIGEWRAAVRVGHVHFCTRAKQLCHNVLVGLLGRNEQWGSAIRIDQLLVCTGIKKLRDDVGVSSMGRDKQRRVACVFKLIMSDSPAGFTLHNR